MTKRLYIETVGCQMNMLDSELVVASLRNRGYELAQSPDQATAILFNTCSVRQRAEDKIYSALGKLRRLKQEHPDKIIGVLGCMAQKDQKLIFQRAPFVDVIVGPGQLHQVPDLIEEVEAGKGRQIEVSMGRRDGSTKQIKRSHESFDPLRDSEMRSSPYQAYVRIQIGCDKFCTYCIVPMVRGPEQGRPPAQILEEAKLLADQGCMEITLLGQTVNSYKHVDGGQTTRLSDLLYQLHDISGIDRIKFVTNYPKDMGYELLEAVRDLPKCSPYLHVPAQSGSNSVLDRMKRGYTVEDYRDMMSRIRETVPHAAVSSDFIVGFCGETDEDFQKTVELVEECRFKNSFIFKYSERPGTKGAEHLPDDVPLNIKKERNNQLLKVQNAISEEENHKFVGRDVDVLVEGLSKAAEEAAAESDQPAHVVQMMGRTHCDRIVVFEGNRRQAGQILPVSIYDVSPHTLFGQVVTDSVGPEVFSLQT
ncbi:MAG: tRNA (N6-isopentenyl adenosine(37)-C2)-methylthiotransferase MiaB [Planctomycetaceae bacterium]|nr:tRNA (N6-isopentenyl adenosine(37)-C2)-methylthiotransferase MiaB [Planctomycetaceae bacterium]